MTEPVDLQVSHQLNQALCDLHRTSDEALEERFSLASDLAIENANRLLRELYQVSPRRYEVFPTCDGEIAIEAPGGPGRSVVLLCDSEGGALCMVNMNGDHCRARYSRTEKLPDVGVREALGELLPESHQTL